MFSKLANSDSSLWLNYCERLNWSNFCAFRWKNIKGEVNRNGVKEKQEDILVEFRWVITIQLEVHGLSVAQFYHYIGLSFSQSHLSHEPYCFI